VKYEYEMLKTNAKVWMHEYLRTKNHTFLVRAIAETRMALAIKEHRHV
jgi:hypothetical protein